MGMGATPLDFDGVYKGCGRPPARPERLDELRAMRWAEYATSEARGYCPDCGRMAWGGPEIVIIQCSCGWHWPGQVDHQALNAPALVKVVEGGGAR